MKLKGISLAIFLRYNMPYIVDLSYWPPNLFHLLCSTLQLRGWSSLLYHPCSISRCLPFGFSQQDYSGRKFEGTKVFSPLLHTPYFQPWSLIIPAFPQDYDFSPIYSIFSGLPDSDNIPFSLYPFSPWDIIGFLLLLISVCLTVLCLFHNSFCLFSAKIGKKWRLSCMNPIIFMFQMLGAG